MNKLAELRTKLDAKKKEGQALLAKLDKEGRFGADDDDNKAFAAIEAEVASISADIAKEERLAEARRTMGGTTASAALSMGTNERDPERTAGFKDIAEFASAVRRASTNAGIDSRLSAQTPSNIHQSNGDGGEGFLVPTEFRDEVVKAVDYASDPILERFNIVPTGAKSIEYVKDETTPWGAAGIEAKWRSEGNAMTPSKLGTQAARMELHDLYAFAGATEEMLEDAPRMASHLTDMAGMAIRYALGNAIALGDGRGKPLGYMNAPALITVPAESGQAAGTIVAANVLNMYSRQMMMGGGGAFWSANLSVLPQLSLMTVGDQPIFMPPAGIASAPGGVLLGLPVVYNEHTELLGAQGDLTLVMPGGYMANARSLEPRFASSMHLWFDYNMRAFRWTIRMSGQPMLSKPVVPAKGGAARSRSHFVTLAAR